MNFADTNCCAIQEITSLSTHGDNGLGALVDFCTKTLNVHRGVRYKHADAATETLFSFYLFTAAVGGRFYTKYGENFAKVIKENGLGEVWESPKLQNVAFHSDHSNQVWIWMPDATAVKAWWAKYQQEKTAKSKPTARPVIEPKVP